MIDDNYVGLMMNFKQKEFQTQLYKQTKHIIVNVLEAIFKNYLNFKKGR